MLARAGTVGKPWTEAEDAALRKVYPRGMAATLKRLKSRSQWALMQRARRIGIAKKPHWTAADDKRLGFLWESQLRLSAIAKQMNRTTKAVFQRGVFLGLKVGAPDGFEYVTEAARRTGFAIETLAKMLREAGVKLNITHSDPSRAAMGKRLWRRHYVDPESVDAVVAEWNRSENVQRAAATRGLCALTLRHWLRRAGCIPPRLPGERRRQHRVPSEVIDRVVAEHRGKAA